MIFVGLLLLLKGMLVTAGRKKFLQVMLPVIVIVCLFLAPISALILFISLLIFIAIVMLFENRFVFWFLILAYSFIILGFMMPSLGGLKPGKRCAVNIESRLWKALEIYAQDNDGQFPDKDGKVGLDMLRTGKYGLEDRFCYCSDNKEVPYIYHGGLTTSSSPDKILIEEDSSNHKGYKNVLYCDGTTKFQKDPNYYAFKSSSLIESLLRLVGLR
jgi:prepilin-type processing-associated H-X9-DG protein